MPFNVNIPMILQLIAIQGLSPIQFCRKNKICYETFKKLIQGKQNVQFTIVLKIAKALDVHACNLITKQYDHTCVRKIYKKIEI
ncbi:MAG: hypothetical protein J6C13_02265 [Clostridia bacterium]|nr:hypothetical protein [Clostridia bacterium]